ncbi:hypothetical protein [Agrobacterium fabrum]|uniref:hypothetical protein n=1 Tax=Agrobacterium fabrum TaxID=1176649 RepID=UPI003B9F7246
MTDTKEPKFGLGGFQAKYLHPLHSFVKYAREAHPFHLMYGCIRLEPADIGGVYIVAVTGHATAIIHDPQGFIEAPVTLDIPDEAFAAAKGIELRPMNYWGDEYEATVPEWLQPGMVYVYSAGMHISPKMRNPAWAEQDDEFQPALYSAPCSVRDHTRGLDYRLTPTETALDWRALLASRQISYPSICFNPVVPALFNPLIEVLSKDHPSGMLVHCPRKPEKSEAQMFILQMTDCPEFIGLWMGLKSAEASTIPEHFFKASQAAEVAEK